MEVELEKSQTFYKLNLLIHISTGFILILSHIWWPLKILCVAILLSSLSIYNIKIPLPRYQKLVYRGKQWFLYDKHDQAYCYDSLQISFDVGWALRIELIGNLRTKLFIFADQLTAHEIRTLRILARQRNNVRKRSTN